MQSLITWLVVVGIVGFAIWMAAREARRAGHAEADLDAEREAREVEQDMADEQAQGQTTAETLDKLGKGKF